MNGWIPLLFAFMAGSLLGAELTSLRLKAKLRLYKRFIEARLNSVNLPRPAAPLTGVH